MLLCDLIQSHYPKILMLSPVPCNLHRNIIVILTTQSRLSPSHIPLIRSLSRPISRTLIAISADADMAAKKRKRKEKKYIYLGTINGGYARFAGFREKFSFHNVLPILLPFLFSLFEPSIPCIPSI